MMSREEKTRIANRGIEAMMEDKVAAMDMLGRLVRRMGNKISDANWTGDKVAAKSYADAQRILSRLQFNVELDARGQNELMLDVMAL